MKLKIIIILSMVLILTSCSMVLIFTNYSSSGASAEAEQDPDKITPNIIRYGDTTYGYSYLIDKNTGVVYLEYYGHKRTAITVMLNADGTPVTADQIGLEY